MTERVDLGVMIGRFSPPHIGHTDAIEQGLGRADHMLILVGSADEPRSHYVPFSYEERVAMLRESMPTSNGAGADELGLVSFAPLSDVKYDDDAWALGVREAAESCLVDLGLSEGSRIGLVGHKKDGTSFYLDMFPDWAEVSVDDTTHVSSTQVRSQFFLPGAEWRPSVRGLISSGVAEQLIAFEKTQDYERLVGEYEHVRVYRQPYEDLPYPPIFVTTDACVVCAGHVLLIRRRAAPGRGLWALPGGFLNHTERVEDGIYRELREETRIDVPEAVLRGHTETIRVFDDPHRSSRGRTITHAALIRLEPRPGTAGGRAQLPRVRGSDDADRARWVPLAGPGALRRDMIFEDHYSIIRALLGGLPE